MVGGRSWISRQILGCCGRGQPRPDSLLFAGRAFVDGSGCIGCLAGSTDKPFFAFERLVALFFRRLLHTLEISVTRLASGLPVGGDLEYADEVTLGRAFEGRRAV